MLRLTIRWTRLLSHILAYYTICCLVHGRRPLTLGRLEHNRLDLWLSVVGLVGCFTVTIFTLIRCRNNWQLLAIGVWKLSTSLVNGIVGTHTAIWTQLLVRHASQEQPTSNPLSDNEDADCADSVPWLICNFADGQQADCNAAAGPWVILCRSSWNDCRFYGSGVTDQRKLAYIP